MTQIQNQNKYQCFNCHKDRDLEDLIQLKDHLLCQICLFNIGTDNLKRILEVKDIFDNNESGYYTKEQISEIIYEHIIDNLDYQKLKYDE